MSHERLHRDNALRGSSDPGFGLVFAAVFCVVALLPLFSHGQPRVWSLVLSAVFLAFALLAPARLAPLNRLWTRFGALLHRIVSPIVLGILFYGIATPTGLVMRALGKDPLRLRRDPAAATYWIERTPSGPKSDSFTHQF